MSYLDAMQNGAAPQGGGMATPPASLGMGAPPSMPGLPPPPTGAGAMPTGAPGTTKMTAGADAIAAIRSLQGFVPELFNETNEWVAKIKSATSSKPGDKAGPALGQPGIPGALELDATPAADSGGPGPF